MMWKNALNGLNFLWTISSSLWPFQAFSCLFRPFQVFSGLFRPLFDHLQGYNLEFCFQGFIFFLFSFDYVHFSLDLCHLSWKKKRQGLLLLKFYWSLFHASGLILLSHIAIITLWPWGEDLYHCNCWPFFVFYGGLKLEGVQSESLWIFQAAFKARLEGKKAVNYPKKLDSKQTKRGDESLKIQLIQVLLTLELDFWWWRMLAFFLSGHSPFFEGGL